MWKTDIFEPAKPSWYLTSNPLVAGRYQNLIICQKSNTVQNQFVLEFVSNAISVNQIILTLTSPIELIFTDYFINSLILIFLRFMYDACVEEKAYSMFDSDIIRQITRRTGTKLSKTRKNMFFKAWKHGHDGNTQKKLRTQSSEIVWRNKWVRKISR